MGSEMCIRDRVYVAKKVLEQTDDVSEVFDRVESGDLIQKDKEDDNLIV